MTRRRILVAPINWGLGHAARCIPLIKSLEKEDFTPVLASDGAALLLLQKEFPHLQSFSLPSYNISYTYKGANLKWKLLLHTPSILNTIQKEQNETKKLVAEENISGIISDNRFGVRHEDIPCAFVTHQLHVLSGKTTFLSSWIHQRIIKKFDECWVPDAAGSQNLSGYLGHLKNQQENIKYLGILSRFKKGKFPLLFDYMVLLSGPEPQRTLLENILLKAFEKTSKKILFVRGVISEEAIGIRNKNIKILNYLYGTELEKAILSSEMIISRSGYTTLMDLAKLEKKAFFIPTPGQPEQDYLASRMKKLGLAPFCKQEDFKLSMLEETSGYSGLSAFGTIGDPSRFFGLFKGK